MALGTRTPKNCCKSIFSPFWATLDKKFFLPKNQKFAKGESQGNFSNFLVKKFFSPKLVQNVENMTLNSFWKKNIFFLNFRFFFCQGGGKGKFWWKKIFLSSKLFKKAQNELCRNFWGSDDEVLTGVELQGSTTGHPALKFAKNPSKWNKFRFFFCFLLIVWIFFSLFSLV